MDYVGEGGNKKIYTCVCVCVCVLLVREFCFERAVLLCVRGFVSTVGEGGSPGINKSTLFFCCCSFFCACV